MHRYFRLFTLSQKKTNCYSLTHHTWQMLPHYLVKCKNFSYFLFLTHIEYQSAIWDALSFSRVWWTMQLINGKKYWKHVSVQKVVTLNTSCNVACLPFHLPHITTGSFPPMPTHIRFFFRASNANPQPAFFQSHQCLEEWNIPSVRWKSCPFYKIVLWHFQVCW